jgi:carboxypeptidase family protein/TonB-dependent receptor-like protein
MASDARQRVRRSPFLAWLLVLAVPSLAAAQTGTITGKVTDESGGAPLEAARVVLSGTTRIETTNREGVYTFRAVSPGSYQLRVLRVGYRPTLDTVRVADGETTTADVAMTAAPVQLEEIVTTVTGEQRKLEIGNSVTTIDAAKVAEQAPITEFTNLISGRAPGVQVLKSSGTTGTGTRIRIRGPTAFRSPTSRCTTSTASGSRAAPSPPRSTSVDSGWTTRRERARRGSMTSTPMRSKTSRS